MSQYVVLIRTAVTPNTVIDPYRLCVYDPREAPITVPLELYALTTSSNPASGLTLLQDYCPVKLELIHTIHSGNRTDYLNRTLQIKFQDRLLHSFWYALDLNDIMFIQGINEGNISNIVGLIHKQLKKPEMNQEQLEQFVSEQLQKAERAL